MAKKPEVRELSQQILLAKHLYYKGSPEITDAAYDALEAKLKKLDPDHPVLSMVGFDADAAGGEEGSSKIEHVKPMLSLRKTYKLAELLSWVDGKDILATPKLDGNSLSLVYEQGQLVQAKTRGDGTRGEDVLAKVVFVPNIPKTLPAKLDLEVRGELICSISQFSKLQTHMQNLGFEVPANPRNTVAGILGRKSHGDLAVYFDFFAFDCLGSSVEENALFSTETQKMDWLAKYFLAPSFEKLSSPEKIETYLTKTQEILATSEWSMDGAVFSYDDLSVHGELGETSHHPRYKMVFKWQGESADTVIKSIDWRTSRAGILTPVAIVEPVDLSGAKISNVTLHNFAFAKNVNAAAGDTIKIVRSGEVIPKYLETVTKGESVFVSPSVCSTCGSGLELRDEVRIYCGNATSCPAQIIGGILHWIVQVGIDDLSEKRLEQLLEAKLVKNPADLYRLKVEDLLQLPQTKEKLATKLVENIEQSKKSITLVSFLSGLGIAGGGKTSWKKITQDYCSLNSVRSISADQLAGLDGFAEKSAETLLDGLSAKKQWIDDLLSAGVVPPDAASSAGAGAGSLSGKSLVITGTLSAPRKQIEQAIEAAGGKASKAVSKNTFALVCNDPESSSSKAKKARSLNIPIWSESDLEQKLTEDIIK